jgi:hypothetical protein
MAFSTKPAPRQQSLSSKLAAPARLVTCQELTSHGDPKPVDIATALFYKTEHLCMRFEMPGVHALNHCWVSCVGKLQSRPYSSAAVFKLLQDGITPLDVYPFSADPANLLTGAAPATRLIYQPKWRQHICLIWRAGFWLLPLVVLPTAVPGGLYGTLAALLALLATYAVTRGGCPWGGIIILSKVPGAAFPALVPVRQRRNGNSQPADHRESPLVESDRLQNEVPVPTTAVRKLSDPEPKPPVVSTHDAPPRPGEWADAVLPASFDLGEIEASAATFEFELALTATTRLRTTLAGARLSPETVPAGISSVQISLDDLAHHTILFSEIELVGTTNSLLIPVHGRVGEPKLASSGVSRRLNKRERQHFIDAFPTLPVSPVAISGPAIILPAPSSSLAA